MADNEVLVSIDPGLRVCGVAVFVGERLVACAAVRHHDSYGVSQRIAMADAVINWVEGALHHQQRLDTLVIERMTTRPGRKDAHANLIDLSHVSGAIWYGLAGIWSCACEEAEPGVWTKGRNKERNHPVIRRRLSSDETAVVEAELRFVLAGDRKEVWDAVGIGLWAIGRLG